MPPTKSIAIITGSTRPSRIGHLIAKHVTTLLSSSLSAHGIPKIISISSIDLAAQALPFVDEAGIPSKFPADNPTPHYTHAHTRAWSAEIRKHSAFVFVTPQYNWGYPAGIKNAIDYLFHEWTGKPVLVVSYGGHGGGRAAAQLLQVFQGLRMKPLEKSVGYKTKLEEGPSVLENGSFSEERMEAWKAEGTDKELLERFEELLGLLT